MKLYDYYREMNLSENEWIKMPKSVLLIVNDKSFDVTPYILALGLSHYEVAITYPKSGIDIASEVHLSGAKFVLQVGELLTRKFNYAATPDDAVKFSELAQKSCCNDDFVVLHHHDEFSLRDGLGKMEDVIDLFRIQGRSYFCVTNHGSVGGWIKQYNWCKKYGIKSIFGIEAYTSSYRPNKNDESDPEWIDKEPAVAQALFHLEDVRKKLLDANERLENAREVAKQISKERTKIKRKGDPEQLEKIESELKKAKDEVTRCKYNASVFSTEEMPANKACIAARQRVKRKGFHLVLLARTREGFDNIIRIHNDAQLNGFYYSPKVNRDACKKWGKGIIATSACAAGEISQLLLSGREKQAEELALFYASCFDRFYLEIQIIEMEEQREVNHLIIKLAQKLNLPLILAVDSHYLDPLHAETHDLLLLMRQQKTIKELEELRRGERDDIWAFSARNLYYRNAEQVRDVFHNGFVDMEGLWHKPYQDDIFTEEILTQAMAETKKIAIEVEEIKLDSSIKLPKLYPNGKEILRQKINEGFNKLDLVKKGNVYVERIAHEYDVITRLGWTDYFLIMERIMNAAKKHYEEMVGIEAGQWFFGYGRGSAAGSLIAYCLGLTGIDPIEYGLLFERFLDEGRPDPPDIDSDFPEKLRDWVKDYIIKEFGETRSCAIGTYSTFKTRAVILDVVRVLGLDVKEANAVTKNMEPLRRFENDDGEEEKVDEMSFDEICKHYPELGAFFLAHPEVKQHAEVLRNQIKNMSVHAGGVIITDLELTDRIPVLLDSKTNKVMSAWVESGNFSELSAVGLVKFDILGLRNLDVISDCIRLIKDTTGRKLLRFGPVKSGYELIPIDDKEAIKVGSGADLVGIFQFENPITREIVDKVKMDCLSDVAAITSLLRPGPMSMGMPNEYAERKHGKPYVMPKILKDALHETYGILVYQEQCCPADVLVLTSSGYRRIIDIVQDKNDSTVLCLNDRGDIVNREVIGKHENGIKEVIRIFLDNGFILECTADHLILTGNRGWVEAQYLTEDDDIVTTEDVMAKLIKIETVGSKPVFDLTVDEYHNFIANGVVVHNCMKISKVLSGFSSSEANKLRKACITADSYFISLSRGPITLSTMLRDGYRDDFFAQMGRDGKIAWARIIDIWKTGKKRVRRTKSRSGCYVDATRLHQFLTDEGWKAQERLKSDDRLVGARKLEWEGEDKISRDMMIVIAGLLTEGYTPLQSERSVTFVNHNKELMDTFIKSFIREFGCKQGSLSPCGYIYRIHKEAQNKIFKIMKRGLSGEKFIPDVMMSATKDSMSSFLSFMLAAEGGVTVSNGTFEYSSKSEKMIRQIKFLLLRFGIRSTFCIKTVEKYGIFYRLFVNDLVEQQNLLSLSTLWPSYKVDNLKFVLANKSCQNFTTDTIPNRIVNKMINQYPAICSSESGSFRKSPVSRARFARVAQKTKEKKWIDISESDFWFDKYSDSEQVVSISCDVYDFTVAEEYSPNMIVNGLVIHNCGKKIMSLMLEMKDKFIEGARSKIDLGEITEDDVFKVWDLIEAFAGYGFNLSHAVSYSAITTVELWLKYNFPLQFIAALCNNTKLGKKKFGGEDLLPSYINYARRIGYKVLGPHINESTNDFHLLDKDGSYCIVFPIRMVKNVSSVAESIVLNRPYNSFSDFFERVTMEVTLSNGSTRKQRPNKRAVESLIAAGTFDIFGSRNDIMKEYYILRHEKEMPSLQSDDEWEVLEKEMIGLCLSKPPLINQYNQQIKSNRWCAIGDFSGKKKAMVFGKIENIKFHTSKKGNQMYIVVLSDGLETLSFFVFNSAQQAFVQNVQGGTIGVFPLSHFDDGDSCYYDQFREPVILTGGK